MGAAASPHRIRATDPGRLRRTDIEIVGYLEKALAPAHHESVAAHIAGCPSCAALLQRL